MDVELASKKKNEEIDGSVSAGRVLSSGMFQRSPRGAVDCSFRYSNCTVGSHESEGNTQNTFRALSTWVFGVWWHSGPLNCRHTRTFCWNTLNCVTKYAMFGHTHTQYRGFSLLKKIAQTLSENVLTGFRQHVEYWLPINKYQGNQIYKKYGNL